MTRWATHPWDTPFMEEVSQTCCPHRVPRAWGPSRKDCPWKSSVAGHRIWGAWVWGSISIWALWSGPHSWLSANGSRPWQRSWRRDIVLLMLSHRLENPMAVLCKRGYFVPFTFIVAVSFCRFFAVFWKTWLPTQIALSTMVQWIYFLHVSITVITPPPKKNAWAPSQKRKIIFHLHRSDNLEVSVITRFTVAGWSKATVSVLSYHLSWGKTALSSNIGDIQTFSLTVISMNNLNLPSVQVFGLWEGVGVQYPWRVQHWIIKGT